MVNTLTSADQSTAQIAALSSGGLAVTWRSDDPQQGDASQTGIKARVFDHQGQQVAAEFLVNELTPGGQIDPAITPLPGRGFVVSWTSDDPQQGDTSNDGIKARIFDADGDPVSGEFLVNDFTAGGQRAPALVSLPSGGFVAVWQSGQSGQGDNSSSAIKARYFDAAGAESVGEFLVNTETANAQSLPAVTSLSNGNVLIAWQSPGWIAG